MVSLGLLCTKFTPTAWLLYVMYTLKNRLVLPGQSTWLCRVKFGVWNTLLYKNYFFHIIILLTIRQKLWRNSVEVCNLTKRQMILFSKFTPDWKMVWKPHLYTPKHLTYWPTCLYLPDGLLCQLRTPPPRSPLPLPKPHRSPSLPPSPLFQHRIRIPPLLLHVGEREDNTELLEKVVAWNSATIHVTIYF